jgi:hypothetical protein
MEMGIAALLPGFTLMRELIQATEDEYRTLLANLQENGHAPTVNGKRRGRPPGASKTILDAVAAAALPAPEEVIPVPVGKKGKRTVSEEAAARAGWAAFDTPEKRRIEMARRMKIRETKTTKTKRGGSPRRTEPMPEQIDGKYVVAVLAEKFGYAGTWGLQTFLRTHNIAWTKVKDPFGRHRLAVISRTNYVRLMRLRGESALDGVTEGMSAKEKAETAELEAMTA